MFRFNYDNVIVGTCFDEWVKSICAELNRVLSINVDVPVAVAKIKADYWSKNETGEFIEARTIYLDTESSIFTCSFARDEYDKYVKDNQGYKQLLQMRLIDTLWSVEDYREELFKILQQFDPEHKTPDDYVH